MRFDTATADRSVTLGPGLFAGTLGIGAVLAALPPTAWPAIAAFLILIGGLPHGASDTALAKTHWRPRLGKSWRGVFLGIYLTTVALVGMSWWVAPEVTLLGFLLLSGWHFGRDDTHAWQDRSTLGPLVRGLLPLTAPTLLFRQDVEAIFSVLAGPGGEEFASSLTGGLQEAALPTLALAALGSLQAGASQAARSLILAAALLTALPPLIGFPLYFVILHSWPQLERRRAVLGLPDLRTYGQAVWPYVGGGFAVIALLAFGLPDRSPTLIFAVFSGLAALTVPHCFLPALPSRLAPFIPYKERREPCPISRTS
jgi:Brp/Blh family beta-carotene 15,15'-monooxygenase